MRHLQLLILLLLPALVHGQPREASVMISGHAANGRQLVHGTSTMMGGISAQVDHEQWAYGIGLLGGERQGERLYVLRAGLAVYLTRLPFSAGAWRQVFQAGIYYEAAMPSGAADAEPQMLGGATFRTLLLGRDANPRKLYCSLDIRLGTGFRRDSMLVPSRFFDMQALLSVHIPLAGEAR